MLRGSNAEKWGYHQKKKGSIGNFVEALIEFNEELQGPLKLQEPLEGVEEGICFEAEK